MTFRVDIEGKKEEFRRVKFHSIPEGIALPSHMMVGSTVAGLHIHVREEGSTHEDKVKFSIQEDAKEKKNRKKEKLNEKKLSVSDMAIRILYI